MNIDLIVFLICIVLIIVIYIIEKVINNNLKKKETASSTMILEASRAKPAELPEPAGKLISESANINRWLRFLNLVKFLFVVIAIICWFV